MIRMSIDQLKERLLTLRGASFATIISETEPDLVGGKKCPVAGVVKVSMVNICINFSYQNAVNRQRVREETPVDAKGEVEFFEPEARKWGQRLHDSLGKLLPLVQHTPKGSNEVLFYLEAKVERSIDHEYILNGKKVADDVITPHLRKKVEGARQEVEKPVILRDYRLDRIRAIKLNGQWIKVKAA